jgi:hypothetical protein
MRDGNAVTFPRSHVSVENMEDSGRPDFRWSLEGREPARTGGIWLPRTNSISLEGIGAAFGWGFMIPTQAAFHPAVTAGLALVAIACFCLPFAGRFFWLVRRRHDQGRAGTDMKIVSGLLVLIVAALVLSFAFVPDLNFFLALLTLACVFGLVVLPILSWTTVVAQAPGDPAPNRYGPPPGSK